MLGSLKELLDEATSLRQRLNDVFAPETARPGTNRAIPSSGHCAAVAAIVQDRLGGMLVSAIVEGESHWFNRLNINGQELDLDLTGDQFGRKPVQIAPAGKLYESTRVRHVDELNAETRDRAEQLAKNANLDSTRQPEAEFVTK